MGNIKQVSEWNMNEVGAIEQVTENSTNPQNVNINIHVGVFFDGTSNNANNNEWKDWFRLAYSLERRHALNNTIIPNPLKKLSNPAILSSLFMTDCSNGYRNKSGNDSNVKEKYLRVYVEGSGANGFKAQNEAIDIITHGKPVKGLGFGVGSTGVVAKVSKAIKYISERVDIEKSANTEIEKIHFYVFGFSRGSTAARLFSYLVARERENGSPTGKLGKEKEFDRYLSKKYFKDGRVRFLDGYADKMSVDFLGIYDTVSAIGFLKDADIVSKDADGKEVRIDGKVNKLRYAFMSDPDFWGNFHRENSKNYGLYSPTLSKVKSTCHICALDEFRSNFALTDVGDLTNTENIELFIPGCHSDVGGGYTATDKAEKKTLYRCFDNQYRTRVCMSNPTNANAEYKELSAENLEALGWITETEKKDVKIEEKGNQGIEFVHHPTPDAQYSNVPLNFMYQRAIKKAKKLEELFSCNPKDFYDIPKDLTDMWRILETLLYKNGRYCYYFGGEYNSSYYKNIRQKYLHFTSTDALHGWGDPGNPPGRKNHNDGKELVSDICRFVYRGDSEDTNVYYMHDYTMESIKE